MEQELAVMGEADIVGLLQRAFVFAKPERSASATELKLESTIDELGIESVSALEMTGFIEEELDIQFHDSELVKIHGMSDLAQLIKKHLAAKHGD